MSEDTATVEAPEKEAPKEQRFNVTVDGLNFVLIEGEVARGPRSGEKSVLLEVDLSKDDPFEDVIKLVGRKNWNQTIYRDVFKPACNDATADSIREEDGEYEDTVWFAKFKNAFVAPTRQSGTGVKQLREKRDALYAKINPLLMKSVEDKEHFTQEEGLELLRLIPELKGIIAQIEKKSRTGAGKKKGTAAKK